MFRELNHYLKSLSALNGITLEGESYKKIYNQIKRDLYTEGDNKHKQIAMALMLVIDCGIRIGSEKYRDENNSFGATTLEPRHFKIKGDGKTISELEKNEKIDKNLLRYLTVKVKKFDLKTNYFGKKEEEKEEKKN